MDDDASFTKKIFQIRELHIKVYSFIRSLTSAGVKEFFLTFIAKACFVLVETLEANSLSDDIQKLIKGRPPLLVIVHLLLRLLAGPAVHHPHLGKQD